MPEPISPKAMAAATRHSYDYAVIRVVPRVEREEFLNAGIILFGRQAKFLKAEVIFDPERILCLYPEIDIDAVKENLLCIPTICAGGPGAGPIGQLSQSERFHWLTAPRSTIIQTSSIHSGLSVSLPDTFNLLRARYCS